MRIATSVEEYERACHRQKLLDANCRAFWIELTPTGFLPIELEVVLGSLSYEHLRIVSLFLASSLKWSCLRQPSRSKCLCCDNELSSEHFFSCPNALFLSGREWSRFFCNCNVWS